MPDLKVPQGTRAAAIEVTVTRAKTGRVEQKIVAVYHEDPLKLLWLKTKLRLGLNVTHDEVYGPDKIP